MKNLITLSIFLSIHSLLAQPLDRTFARADGAVNLLGQVTLDRLKEDPFQEWFQQSYDEYAVDTRTIMSISLPDSITVFMGTWCGDSRREVPRFVKMLEQTQFDLDRLKIISLNTGFQNYKQAPEREERGANIHRVPTFILHDVNQKEIGRIVERPVISLEQDLKDLMERKPYETYYVVANDLIEKFETYSVKELRKRMSSLIKEYAGQTAHEHELNTYGYVLWTSFDLMKAEFVFELNAKLYPGSSVPFSALARFKDQMGKRKEAMTNLRKGLTNDPEDERLLAIQADME